MLYNLKEIRVHRGERCILNIQQLDITRGNVYSLVGPNGAGKSTLLNILAFLLKPDTGKMVYDGTPVECSTKAYHKLRQKIVLVDQYPILFTGPVWKSIDFALKIRKVSKQQRKIRIAKVLKQVGMQEFSTAEAHKLSGGETKRIALARALAIEPEVLLCDEPTANVDTENQERILDILDYCNKNQKTSLIFATHYLSQAQRLADHSIVLQNGSISAAGNDNIFTTRYVGSKQNMEVWTIGADLLLSVPKSLHSPQKTYSRVQIDPCSVSISRSPHVVTRPAIEWKGTIVRIASESGEARITVDCGLRVDVLLSRDVYKREQFLLGEDVCLLILAEKCVFA